MEIRTDGDSKVLPSIGTSISVEPTLESSTGTPRKRIAELDGLRGMAILLVLLYHYISIPSGGAAKGLFQRLFAIGWSGVDLFFVLSGFLIGGILLDARESPRYFGTFYGRRFYRIVPLYYLWIGVFFMIAAFRPQPETLPSLGIYLLFLQNSVKIYHADFGTAWLGALWSLAVEEQFYLVVPTVVRVLSRRNLLFVLGVAIAVPPVLRIILHRFLLTHAAAPYMLTACRADALAMGVALAVGWRSEKCRAIFTRQRSLIYAVSLLLFGAFLYLAVRQPSQYTLTMYSWGLSAVDAFFASLLAIALTAPGSVWATVCRFPLLRELGRVSYCLYVIHQTVDLTCHKLLLNELPRFDNWKAALLTVCAAVLAYCFAALSWRFFENPLLRKGHRLKY
jgi:peptidoglycan/LPS O-acetylase OafA/YrhL